MPGLTLEMTFYLLGSALSFNKKSFFSILLFILLASSLSCGVKNAPVPPSGTYLPSVESHYLKKREEQKKEKQDQKQKEEN